MGERQPPLLLAGRARYLLWWLAVQPLRRPGASLATAALLLLAAGMLIVAAKTANPHCHWRVAAGQGAKAHQVWVC